MRPVSNIAQIPLSQLVTKPSGLVLQVAVGDWSVDGLPRSLRHATTAMADWHEAPYLTEDWNVPMARVFDRLGLGVSRYASFTVDLAYRRQQRRYAALFLFGQDDDGKATVIPVDHIVGAHALEKLLRSSITPGPLSSSRYRTRPEVKAFANSARGLAGCAPDAASELCCDGVSGRCGLTPEALPGFAPGRLGETGSAADTEPEMAENGGDARPNAVSQAACNGYNTLGLQLQYSPVDLTQHVTGSHGGTVTLQGQCGYTAQNCACVPNCHVNGYANPYENGFLLISLVGFTHETSSNYGFTDGQPGATCSGAVGIAVQDCFYGICLPVSIGISGASVSFSGATIWTYPAGTGYGPCSTVQ